MADFLLTEAVDDDAIDEGNIGFEGNINDEMTISDEEFIDDSEINESITDHYGFTNVSRGYTEAVEDSFLILILMKNRIIIVMKMKFAI